MVPLPDEIADVLAHHRLELESGFLGERVRENLAFSSMFLARTGGKDRFCTVERGEYVVEFRLEDPDAVPVYRLQG